MTTTNEKSSQKNQQNLNKEDTNSQERRSSNSSSNSTISSLGNSTGSDSFGNSTKGLVVKTLKYSDEQLAQTTTKKSFIPNLLLGSNVSKINPTANNPNNNNIPQNLHPSLVLDNKWKTNENSCVKKGREFERKNYLIWSISKPLRWVQRMRRELKDDFGSILLLLLLYLLQGIPLGLIGAIPLLLQSKGITYAQQAVFSFAYWPFSMKLLWAPIVDSIYFKTIGRRKSWMVPCQYLIGIFLLVVSYHVPEIMGSEEDRVNKKPPNVFFLMCVFLPLNFLAATQDIAVDGWALTMLSRKNVGYASTCNVVGQTIGVFLGNVVFLALQSKEFANRFRAVPEEKGFVQLDGWFFLIFFLKILLKFFFPYWLSLGVCWNFFFNFIYFLNTSSLGIFIKKFFE
ncbi:unnamed protein product [Meloidogyne enterolobii]|uniref:Uncharacterized protein n=1 Tax=Meloidogyne enterolobii TaxID=390850 RepID=A0ACB0Z8N4_MELEN